MKLIKGLVIGIGVLAIIVGCAGREVEVVRPDKITTEQKNVFVFPFRNAFYKGRELHGVGREFSATFVSEIVATGRECRLIANDDFKDTIEVDVNQACSYGKEHGVKIHWLDSLIVRLSHDAADDANYSLKDGIVTVQLNPNTLKQFIEGARKQINQTSRYGHGSPAACGLWFSPDWLGAE